MTTEDSVVIESCGMIGSVIRNGVMIDIHPRNLEIGDMVPVATEVALGGNIFQISPLLRETYLEIMVDAMTPEGIDNARD